MSRFSSSLIDVFQGDNARVYWAQFVKACFNITFTYGLPIAVQTLNPLEILGMCCRRLYAGIRLFHHQYKIMLSPNLKEVQWLDIYTTLASQS